MVAPINKLFVLLFLLSSLTFSRNAGQQNDGDNGGDLKTIRFLALVQWRDELERDHAGWDVGPDMLAAGRVAVKEVNERPDLLRGYRLEMVEARHEACGLTEANLGVNDLVSHAINPPNGTAVAVLGLFCSTSARVIAPIAGRAGIIQISAANSPIFTNHSFHTHDETFPHLWRILGSASVYADMMVALMDRFGWNRVGVVQDLETIFHSGIAEAFLERVNKSSHIKLTYHGGLIQTREDLINKSLQDIKDNGTRIVFLQTTGPQTSKFLCAAADRGMVYPYYMWVITDFFLSGLIYETANLTNCNEMKLRAGANGSLVGFFALESSYNGTNASGETYAEYQEKYERELDNTRAEYYDTGEVRGDVLYAGLLYDQVWALALAIEDAMPKLLAENISIENFRFGDLATIEILEESLSRISFYGATGHIRFTSDRQVLTPVNIYQIDSDNDTDIYLGYFNPETKMLNMTEIYVPEDRPRTELVFLPTYAAVLLYVGTVAVAVGVTVILTCLMYHRHKPQIKASSPFFSLIMFAGCYCLCGSCAFAVTYISFLLPEIVFRVFCNTHTFLLINGVSLIFVTLFIKLLRIHKIFNNKKLSVLGWVWETKFLTFIVTVITIFPNIILVLWMGLDTVKLIVHNHKIISDDAPLMYVRQEHVCSSQYSLLWYSLSFTCLAFILILIVILAARTRKIKHRNFKDTKKVNAFIFVFVMTFTMSWVALTLLREDDMVTIGRVIFVLGIQIMVIECQVMLFVPKIFRSRSRRNSHYTITEGILGVIKHTV